MAKNLSSIKNLWKKAVENKGSGQFEDLDDGRYLTIITDTDVNESQGSGRLQMMIEFKVQDGEFEGKTKRLYIGLDQEVSIQIAVNTLNRLGIEVEDPGELEEKLKSAIGKVVRIQLKTKSGKSGDFQNVYILKVMGASPVEGSDSGPAAPVDEPEPEELTEVPATPAKPGKKAKPAPAPEPEPEPEPEEVELKVGMKVLFNFQKKEVEGEVSKIEEDKGTVLVRYNGTVYRVPGDSLSVMPG